MKVRSQKSAKAEADRLFSLIIRSRGHCERCGTVGGRLETSHIHSRTGSSTRCDEDNAFCFCSSCHRWWHAHPSLTAEFVFSRMSLERVEALNLRSLDVGTKVDWNVEVARLKARWEELQS